MSFDLDHHDDATHPAMGLHRRPLSDEQFRTFEGFVAEIFTVFGLDLNTPATIDTPRRFLRAMFDATAEYDGDPKLLRVFDTECRDERARSARYTL